ncbi:MAG: 3-hydroxy-9,10-secoandrosta,3,5(10)-triene-9,17-dione monooxygenase [Actinomycetota bacterium]|jgi:3-hydroxy-9,10-secoandrosta-1,3,5(10)-triene-9,17-dione monooxygenase|nr:3-hydroxy-9,10-secoandrosta,3,5(10)-triene-9,17-dione monooxygenase [Actinomycetota bacterium]
MTITGAKGRDSLVGLTKEDAIARARDLAAGLVERRAETEALRRLPDATMEEFVASGLMRLNQASRWGGAELGTEAAVEVIAEVAKGDASAGWVFGLIASHFWLVCLFPPEAQDEMWGADPNVMMSSSFAATEGTFERVDGGYRVKGRWPFSSGADHCSWAMLGIVLPPAGPDQMPTLVWGVVPRDDYRVDDDWRTVGMRGTGSNTLIVEDAFIPDHRCINPWEVSAGTAPGTAINPAPLFRLPFGPALAYYLSAPALGAAERTLADWVQYIAGKRQVFTGAEVGKQAPTLIRAGELSAQLEAARLLMTATPRAIDEAIERGPLDQELRVRSGRNATYAVRMCVDVVERCMQFSGGTGLFESHPVQQGWRDVHGVAAHVGFGIDNAYGTYGNILLGLPVTPSPML